MRYAYRLIIIILLATTNGACVSKMSIADGINSFRVHDYRRAFIRLKPAAIRGNIDAQYAVGFMYYYGEGVVEDKAQALYWISKAAHAGQNEALAAMAILNNHPEDLH